MFKVVDYFLIIVVVLSFFILYQVDTTFMESNPFDKKVKEHCVQWYNCCGTVNQRCNVFVNGYREICSTEWGICLPPVLGICDIDIDELQITCDIICTGRCDCM